MSGLFLSCSVADFPKAKVIYLAIHPFLGFCAARTHIAFHELLSSERPDKQVAAPMRAPPGPDTANAKLTGGQRATASPHQKGRRRTRSEGRSAAQVSPLWLWGGGHLSHCHGNCIKCDSSQGGFFGKGLLTEYKRYFVISQDPAGKHRPQCPRGANLI